MFSSTFKTFAFLAIGAATVRAHVEVNWPQGQYNFTEEQQESGGLCGGGSRGATNGWGIAAGNPFVSVSGDAGASVTVKLLVGSSDTFAPNETKASDFNITLAENVVFGESGNLCFNVSVPGARNIAMGAMSTLYVEATEGDETVSACAAVSLINEGYDDSSLTAVVGGEEAEAEDGTKYTNFDFFCSNGTILARAECDCHCHGAEEHCTAVCTDDQVSASREQCAAKANGGSEASHSHSADGPHATSGSGCDCHCHGAEEHCSEDLCTDEEVSASKDQCAASANGGPSSAASAASEAAASATTQPQNESGAGKTFHATAAAIVAVAFAMTASVL